jgi:hypothetical protein
LPRVRRPTSSGPTNARCSGSARRYCTHGVPDAQYAAAVSTLGERAVVELVGILGYYTLIAMTLNVFEIDAPESTTAKRLR